MTPEQILNEAFTIHARPKTGAEHIAALAEAGYRIVPTVDDETRREVEALIAAIRAMRPDPNEPCPNEPCPPGWDSDDRQGDRNIYRAAELLAAALKAAELLAAALKEGNDA